MGRLRHRLPRSRVPWRLRLLADPAMARYAIGVVLLASLLATLVGRSIAAAEHARSAWGRRIDVVVAARPLSAGDRIDADATRIEAWPAAVVPDGVLQGRVPTDAVAAGALAEGVPIATDALRPPGAADGARRTVALPLAAAALPVEVGELVDVWTVVDAALVPDARARAERVAQGAEVIERRDASVVVAVARDEVEAIAAAATSSRLVLVGSP